MKHHLRDEQLVGLATARLPRLSAWRCQRHVEHCAACQERLESLTQLAGLVRDTYAVAPSLALDQRMQASRPSRPMIRPTISLVRLPAPIVGTLLGLVVGLVCLQGVPSKEYYAETSVTFTQAPEIFPELAEPLLKARRIEDDTDGDIQLHRETAPSHWQVTFGIHASDKEYAQEALASWLECIENPTPILGRWKQSVAKVTVVERSVKGNRLLAFVVMGFFLGGLLSLLRIVAPWIPGGVIGCTIVALVLGVQAGKWQGGTWQPQYLVTQSVAFQAKPGLFHDDPATESYLSTESHFLRGYVSETATRAGLPAVSLSPLSTEKEGEEVLETYAPTPASGGATLDRLIAALNASKVSKALGYSFKPGKRVATLEPGPFLFQSWVAGIITCLVSAATLLTARRK
ncbi:anti-sigma factor family protein [Armatimonas rosea]|uniref:Uncharacterized protein n=1 Tax=Armatimonas rosea TaxID=685828 RepID=A0A7W9WA61_ARMRO|nr:hypothetical protein [Armatimonas rosea]MBB6054001.1 hypothetical protein [Armatimonas rosea]